MHIKSKYILYEFLLILLFLTINPITAAKESSIFNLGIAGELCTICEIFSSSVIRPTRSSTLLSISASGSR